MVFTYRESYESTKLLRNYTDRPRKLTSRKISYKVASKFYVPLYDRSCDPFSATGRTMVLKVAKDVLTRAPRDILSYVQYA